MKLHALAEFLVDPEKTRTYLRARGLLMNNFQCPSCHTPMSEQGYARSIDKVAFKCNQCSRRTSIRDGSIFAGSHLSLAKLLGIFYLTSLETLQKNIAETLEIDHKTIIDWQQRIRDVYTRKLLRDPITLGGTGVIVEIDESLLARAKSTRNRRARHVRQQWMFGMFDRTQKKGLIFMVPDRSAETLIPIIQRHLLPGTLIYSDGWRAYSALQDLGFSHAVVVHQNQFVNTVTGVHTNNVENYWRRCKSKFKRISGTYRCKLASYLDEFMWNERWGTTAATRLTNTLGDIAALYPLRD
jgi:transposase-like protein/IS1 family transposase